MKKRVNCKSRRLTPRILELYKNTDLTSCEIGKLINLSTVIVKRVAKENGISKDRYIKRPKSHHYDKERNDKIINLIRQGLTYDEVGEQMGITKQRVCQIAKYNNISRWDESREFKVNLISRIKEDIDNQLPYTDIVEKHNLRIKGYLLRDTELSGLYTDMLIKRNEAIKKKYEVRTAEEIINDNDYNITNPTKPTSINCVYRIASSLGFKKYPMIGDRSKGNTFEDRTILKYIRDRRDKDGWTFKKIACELNKLNYRTVTGKLFTTSNVNYKYHK